MLSFKLNKLAKISLLLTVSILFANSLWAAQVENSYGPAIGNDKVSIGSSKLYYVSISNVPNNAIITKVEAKFTYTAYGVVQKYVSCRFNKDSDPGSHSGIVLVSKGSLSQGKPGTFGYKSFNGWNGKSVNGKYYFRFATASGSPYSPTIHGVFVKVTYTVNSILSPPVLIGPKNNETVSSITLNWQQVSSSTGYELDVDGNQVIIKTGSQTNYPAKLNYGTHKWRARTKNSSGTYGQWSGYAWFKYEVKLPAPIIISPKDNKAVDNLLLKWQPVENATGYHLEVDGNPVKIHKGSNTSYTAKLNYGVHKWRIRAANSSGGYGSWSDYAYFKYEQVLSEPTLIGPKNNETVSSVVLRWQKINNAVGYELEVDGNQVIVKTGSQVDYPAKLNYGTHKWRVRTKNSSGAYGSWSDYVYFKYEVILLPPITIGPKDNVVVDNPILKWQPVGNATGYQLEVDGNPVKIHKGNDSSYTAKLNYGTHKWRIQTASSSGTYGPWSEYAWFKYEAKLLVPVIIGPKDNTVVDNLLLKWQPVSNAAGYQLEVDGNLVKIHKGTDSSYTAKLNYGAHKWRVRAISGSGSSGQWSEYANFRYAQVPSPPRLKAPFGNIPAGSDIIFSWNTSPGAARYRLKICVDALMSKQIPGSPFEPGAGQTSYTVPVSKFAPGKTYYWQIGAIAPNDIGGWSSYGPATPWSITITTKLLSPPILISPKDNKTVSSVLLKWQRVNNAAGYELDVDGNQVIIKTSSQTSYSAKLNHGTHKWRARTANSFGKYGQWSEYAYFKYERVLSPPTLKSPSGNIPSGSDITFTWNVSLGAVRYRLKICTDLSMKNQISGSPFEPGVGQTSYKVLSSKVIPGETYYWQAGAIAQNAIGGWSSYGPTPPWSFTVVPKSLPPQLLPSPIIISPKDNAAVDNLLLKWQRVSNAAGYQLEVDGKPVKLYKGTDTSYPAKLNYGIHRWRARTKNSFGIYGPWSDYARFKYEAKVPAPIEKFDFSVKIDEISGDVKPGSNISIKCTVNANGAPLDPDKYVLVCLYLSRDKDSITSLDMVTIYGDLRFNNSELIAGSATKTINVTIPKEVSGSWYIVAKVDCPDYWQETSENNNVVSWPTSFEFCGASNQPRIRIVPNRLYLK